MEFLGARARPASLERRGQGAGGSRELPAWEARRRSRAPLRGLALAVVGAAQPGSRRQAGGAGVGATGAGRCRARRRPDTRTRAVPLPRDNLAPSERSRQIPYRSRGAPGDPGRTADEVLRWSAPGRHRLSGGSDRESISQRRLSGRGDLRRRRGPVASRNQGRRKRGSGAVARFAGSTGQGSEEKPKRLACMRLIARRRPTLARRACARETPTMRGRIRTGRSADAHRVAATKRVHEGGESRPRR